MKMNFYFNAAMQELESLTAGVEQMHQELQCSDRQVLELTLILEELCANIIMHGGKQGASKIEVCFEKDQDVLEVVIRDDGPPFDPTGTSPVDIHAPLEERDPGGLGIHLVHHFADNVEYRRHNGNNIVLIRKRL